MHVDTDKRNSADATARGRQLLWILLAGLLVRVVLLVAMADTGVHTGDERDYVELARSIHGSHEFGFAGRLTSIRPPLYPAFVAGLWFITGPDHLNIVRAAQVVLSLGTVILVFLLARLLFDAEVAIWAAAAWCFYPSFLFGGGLILTEVLFTFLLLSACVCTVLAITRPGQLLGWAFLAGMAVGLAALTRSVLWPLPLVLVPLVAVLASGSWSRRALGAAVLAVGYLLVVGPWAARNTMLQKTFVVVDTMGGLNLRMGNFEYTLEDRMWDGVSLKGEKSWSYAMVAENPQASYWTEGLREKWARKQATAYMFAHPWTTMRRAVLKFADFWGLEREYIAALSLGIYDVPGWFKAVTSALVLSAYVVSMALGCIGFFTVPWRNWRLHVVVLLFLVWICGIHTLVFGHSRYHLPVMPIVVVYAAAAVAGGRTRAWRTGGWRTIAAIAVIALLACIWAREILLRDADRIRKFLG